MEHFRRLGFADKVRELGLPFDYPTDITYFTRYTAYELARFSLPSSKEAKKLIKSLSGSWSAAELPHRVSQMLVERVLRDQAAKLPSVVLNFGTSVKSVSDVGELRFCNYSGEKVGEDSILSRLNTLLDAMDLEV